MKNENPIYLTAVYGCAWLFLSTALMYLVSLDVYVETQLFWSAIAIVTMFAIRAVLMIKIGRFFDPVRYLRILFILIAGMISLRYIFWRTTHSLPMQGDLPSIIGGFVLYFAEVQAVILFLLGMFLYVYPRQRDPIPLPKDGSLEAPTVDVFVPTYNEPTALLRTTLLAVGNIRYPADKMNVYLLDDGGTVQKRTQSNLHAAQIALHRHEELQALCAELGVNYLTRERNEEAKAGNVNSALRQTHGELILILDCDHVPTVDFLENTVVPFTRDEKVYLVQTPHFLVNDDAIERNVGRPENMPSEAEMFYTSTMRGLDNWDAAFFCGSGGVLRRSALEEIGGISTDTVTEDIDTSVELASRGYKSIYYHLPMLAGLQPETIAGFMTQRLRWAHGMLQVLLLKRPLIKRGLGFWQRFAFFNMTFYWMFSLMRLAFLLAPVAYLCFGIGLYAAPPSEILIYAMPNLIAFMLYFNVMFGRQRWFLTSEVYEVLQALFNLRTVLAVFLNPRQGSFNVTPKDENIDKDFVTPLAKPIYLLFGLMCWAMYEGFVKFLDFDSPFWSMDVAAFCWCILSFMLVIGAMSPLHERKQRRYAPRFKVDVDAGINGIRGQSVLAKIVDMSAHGLRVKIQGSDSAMVADKYVMELFCQPLNKQIKIHVDVIGRDVDVIHDQVVLRCHHSPLSVQEERDFIGLAYGDSERWRKVLINRNKSFGFWSGLVFFFTKNLPGGIAHLVFELKESSVWVVKSLSSLFLKKGKANETI
ncbi:MAG: UDP-forming cellulose synthase catalytic subunit [Zetaproteobacteria bacterium]|nr:UDP-forming cellulose synthase catalytic subunit [Zetaproteobacteria bacterium]